MDNSANTIQNNDLARLAARAPERVLNSIKKASAHTGVNFAYLMQQASAESSFDPKARAKGSSASGLYQFIESTWISMVKKYGDKYGMGDLASKISNSGKVSDKETKKQILALRNDPEKSSALAAEFANENKTYLQGHWGGKVGSTELYFAHFMGAGSAAEFLKARDDNPMQQAAVLFPKEAAANRNVFYDTTTGRAKTMDEVYAYFDRKFDIKSGVPGMAQDAVQVADAGNDNGAAKLSKADVESVVFNNSRKMAHGYGSLFSGVSHGGHSPLLANPLDLIMLSQTDLPGTGKARDD